MSTEALTLEVPTSLAQELESASQEFLVELLERGLHQLKIERALDRYARGGFSFGAAAHQAGVDLVHDCSDTSFRQPICWA